MNGLGATPRCNTVKLEMAVGDKRRSVGWLVGWEVGGKEGGGKGGRRGREGFGK